jgi:hypothetical protein
MYAMYPMLHFFVCNKCDVAYIACNKCNVCNKRKEIWSGMTVQLSEYFLFEESGTEHLLKVFLHINCEQIHFLFYFFAFSQKKK